jgi:hypothetical protein
LEIPLDSLRVKVRDPDDDLRSLNFSIHGNRMISWTLDSVKQIIQLTAAPDWNGREQVIWMVQDKGGLSDSDTSWITVIPVADPPRPFNLIGPMLLTATFWPDTINFTWYATTDEYASDLVYLLRIRGNDQTYEFSTTDTSLLWINTGMPDGVFFWSVFAYSPAGLNRESGTTGILQVQPSAIGSNQPAPTEFRLMRNYPNPFNPETRIEYHLPKSCRVRLSVMNMLGQDISVLVDGWESVGIHNAVWNGSDRNGMKVPAGVYFYRLIAGDRVFNQKMLLIE